MALISKSEAARRLGRDPAKITKLIKDGKLRTFKPIGQREQVDEDDIERIRIDLKLGEKFTPNTMRPIEPDNAGVEHDARSTMPANKKKIADLTEDDFNLFNSQGKLDAVACRAWGEFEDARTKNVKRLALEGEYVLAAEVGPRFERAMLTIQKGVLATKSRLKALHPDLSEPVLDSLDRLLREALEKAVEDSINGN